MLFLKNERMDSRLPMVLISLISIFIMGCAKELADEYPDNFNRDYIAVSSLSEGALLSSTGNGSLAMANVSDEERGIYALNEVSLRKVQVIGGKPEIRHLFDDLKLESQAQGEVFKINFKLTNDKLIAYFETDGHQVGEANQDLAINWQGKKQVAIFHYPVSSFGFVRNKVNSTGETTNEIEYVETEKSNATHFKLSGLSDARVLNGLRGYHDKKVITKKGLKKKIWSYQGLKKIITMPEMDADVASSLGQKIYKTKILDKILYAQTPLSYKSLTKFEKILFDKKDPRMTACAQEVTNTLNLEQDDKCVLVPVFQISVTHARLKLAKDSKGELTGSISLDTAVENENSKFLLVEANTYAETVDLAKEAGSGMKEENTFSKEAFSSSEHTTESLAKLLNFPNLGNIVDSMYKNVEKTERKVLLQTKIFDSKLYLMLPKTISMLSIVEKAAIGKTPLIQKCDKIVYQALGVEKDNCVMAPIFSKSLTYSKLRFKYEAGSQVPKVEVVNNVPKEQATIVVIDSDKKFSKVEFGHPVFNFMDVLDKTAFQNKVMSKDELMTRLNIDLGDHKNGLVKIIDFNLWVLTAVDINSLSLIEQGALGTDPRYQKCSDFFLKTSGLSAENCVMKPQFYRGIGPMKLSFKRGSPDDELKMPFPEPSDEENGFDFFMTTMSVEPTPFDYNDNHEFPGEILTKLSKHFDTESKYLYVPMTMGTPREVVQAAPFYQGQAKVVKLYVTKKGIEVLEMDKDPRFRDNPLNNTPVLTLPGRFVDFECRKDKKGKCTSGVSQVYDRDWDTKRYFIPKPESLQIQEQNFLDLVSVESDPCIYKIGQPKLVDYEIKKGVINIQLEKTYKTSSAWRCVAENYFKDTEAFTGFSTLGFKVQYFYSLVRLEDLASKDYEPVEYPLPEHGDFGYFKSKTEVLDDQFDSQRKVTKYFLNRWNPKKKTIVYYLSDSYNQPEQKLIKEATYKAFETINATLRAASTGIQLVLKEPSGKKVGDLRNNVLQLVTDPLSNGLLGYAPSVKNPYTGEIVQGHVNMYSGVLKTLTRMVWESMVDLSEKLKNASSTPIVVNSSSTDSSGSETSEESGQESDSVSFSLAGISKDDFLKNINHHTGHNHMGHDDVHHHAHHGHHLEEQRHNLVWAPNQNHELVGLEKIAKKEMERLDMYARNNAYAVEFYQIAHTAKALLPGIEDIQGVLNSDGTLKRWSELSKSQQKEADEIILPYTYTSTLVHEMGHNLGLRHNFSGSFDGDNFFTKEEAQALGLHSIPAYSSVMDYAISTLNELTVFGKYDMAALQFAYDRSVELESGETVKVETTLTDLKEELEVQEKKLKSYQFCTDENAGLSTSCNRFDEGTTLVEVTKAAISRYKDNYKYRNFRDGRNEFRAEGLGGYLVARYFEFGRIRDTFEEYEFFGSIFGQDFMAQGCSPAQTAQYPVCKMINDRRDSVKEAGEFFLEVLKTPDHLCALATPDAPEKTVELKKLVEVYDDIKWDIEYVPTSCFDPAVKAKLAEGEEPKVVKGEAGKFLNGFKDTDPDHPYSNDRAVRGIWIDKIMAMKSLFQRQATRGNTEKIHGALIDNSEISRKVTNFIEHITMGNKLEEPIPFKTESGSTYTEKYKIGLDYKIDGPQRGLRWVKYFLGLPMSGKAKLNKILLKTASDWGETSDDDYSNQSLTFINGFSVRKKDIEEGMNENIVQTSLDGIIYGATSDNTVAKYMIESLENLDFLKSVSAEVMAKVIKERSLPDDLNENQIAATKLPADLLDTLIQLATDGRVIPDDVWLRALGDPVLAANASSAYKLGAEGLIEVKTILANLEVVPDDATEEVKKLYTVSLTDLKKFVSGELESKVDSFKTTLPILPKNLVQNL